MNAEEIDLFVETGTIQYLDRRVEVARLARIARYLAGGIHGQSVGQGACRYGESVGAAYGLHLIIEGVREVALDLVEEGATHDRHLVLGEGAVVVADVVQVGTGVVADVNGVPGVVRVVASAEHELRTGGVDVAATGLLVKEGSVQVDSLLAAVVTVHGHQVVPLVVVHDRIGGRFPKVAVATSRSVGGKGNLVGNSLSQLPAPATFASLGDPWFPVAVGFFLHPRTDAELGPAAEYGLALAVVHVHVLVAVQVYGLARTRVCFGYVCGAVGGAVIVVARGVVEVAVVEEPLAEQTVARRRVKPVNTLNHREYRAVVEARGHSLVRVRGKQAVGGAPLVGEIALHH